jgi:hypothetical protein
MRKQITGILLVGVVVLVGVMAGLVIAFQLEHENSQIGDLATRDVENVGQPAIKAPEVLKIGEMYSVGGGHITYRLLSIDDNYIDREQPDFPRYLLTFEYANTSEEAININNLPVNVSCDKTSELEHMNCKTMERIARQVASSQLSFGCQSIRNGEIGDYLTSYKPGVYPNTAHISKLAPREKKTIVAETVKDCTAFGQANKYWVLP